VNINSTVGAVGFVPRYARNLYPVGLIQVDETSGEPIRGKNGLCVQCKPGGLWFAFLGCLFSFVFGCIIFLLSEVGLWHTHDFMTNLKRKNYQNRGVSFDCAGDWKIWVVNNLHWDCGFESWLQLRCLSMLLCIVLIETLKWSDPPSCHLICVEEDLENFHSWWS
jgi:hypothetical protein